MDKTIVTKTDANLMPDWIKRDPVLAQRWHNDLAFRASAHKADKQMRIVLTKETYRIYNA